VQIAIRLPSNKLFRPPVDMVSTPMVMYCAGTGLAPFRGFIQERAQLIRQGQKLAPALLFAGSRSAPLYEHEVDEWCRAGAVDLRYAFSRASEESQECKYVQDRIWRDRKDMVDMWRKGAKFYVCGSRRVANEIEDVSIRIVQKEMARGRGELVDREEAEEWLRRMRNERFVSDIFG
jgi:cytochrome P450 / NADPH-cytochrome P450 reductase